MATMTKQDKVILTDLIDLFLRLTADKKLFLLGYAQAQADASDDGYERLIR